MALTKTKFINYVRCPRYAALDDVKRNKLDSSITFEEYSEEEQEEKIKEIMATMYDEDDNDLIDKPNPHLEVMLPFYNQVEIEAGHLCKKYFKGKFKFAKDTKNQICFEAFINSIRYVCYVDIYNETEDNFNIIEVKATTSKKYLSIGKKIDNEIVSIFQKKDGIYYLLDDLDVNIEDYMDSKSYYKYREKLFDKFSGPGHYIYDLAVQKYIIDHDDTVKNKNVKYYLAVLNHEYIFDGEYKNTKPNYKTDEFGNDIVVYFDFTKVVNEYLDKIDIDRRKVESYIYDLNPNPCPIGEFCENKKQTKCKYSSICWNFIPPKNSILNFIDAHHGFKDEFGTKYDRYELVNNGIVNMTDIPTNYLNREKNVIQKEVVLTKTPYMNINKIRDGIKQITYPIYHLDFETFPCPFPRFKGEKCYTQSVFQFSLHIEKEYHKCDKEKDHYEFLAHSNLTDEREELVKKLVEYIDTNSGGTILVYNESFEKTRLKELAIIYPQYKKELMKMREMIFDLMNITKTNSKLYEELGYDKKEASMFNYYHYSMSGSFSIKKILPLFSNLTYQGMEVANGVDALVTYASFSKMNELEFAHKYQKLLEYCKQDTWAMVEILWGLIEAVK